MVTCTTPPFRAAVRLNSGVSAHKQMLKLSAAYGAKWRSAFGERELRYNERLWRPIEESHSPEDMLFGLIDHTDGSSFLIRIETLENAHSFTDEDLSDELLDPYLEESYQATGYGDLSHEVSGVEFSGFSLRIVNPKFGDQYLQVLFSRDQEQVTIVQFTWPTALSDGYASLPIKHLSLLQGLSL